MTDITDAHVVKAYAPSGGFGGWRAEYTHADGSTTHGRVRWLAMYADQDIVEAKRAAGLPAGINDRQRAAVQRLIEQHITPGHRILHQSTKTPWVGSHVYVRFVAGLCPGTQAYDDATTAERFARSGFHVRIGARGAVKHIK